MLPIQSMLSCWKTEFGFFWLTKKSTDYLTGLKILTVVLKEEHLLTLSKAGLTFLSKTPEFQKMLLEVSIKTKNTGANIEIVLAQNQKLKELIQKELKQ